MNEIRFDLNVGSLSVLVSDFGGSFKNYTASKLALNYSRGLNSSKVYLVDENGKRLDLSVWPSIRIRSIPQENNLCNCKSDWSDIPSVQNTTSNQGASAFSSWNSSHLVGAIALVALGTLGIGLARACFGGSVKDSETKEIHSK